MKTYKTFYALFSAILIFMPSCGDSDNESNNYALAGEWQTIVQSISTENSETNFDNTINQLLAEQREEKKIETEFKAITEGNTTGLVVTKITKTGTTEPEYTTEYYKTKGDSIIISNTSTQEEISMFYNVGQQILITKRSLSKKDIVAITLSLGVHRDIPDNIKGMLITKMGRIKQ